jgi:hypothetical protein
MEVLVLATVPLVSEAFLLLTCPLFIHRPSSISANFILKVPISGKLFINFLVLLCHLAPELFKCQLVYHLSVFRQKLL